MSLQEDLETITPEAGVQIAYNDSARIEFGTEKMHPWTIARHSAAMSMGCSVMSAVGPDTVGLLSKGNYSNIFRDVVIAMWISSLSDHAVIKLNYHRSASDLEQAFSWAEAIGLTYGSKLFLEGVKLLDKIVSDILASFFSIEGNKPDAIKKKDTNQLGKSKSPTTRRKQAEKQVEQ